MKPDKRRIEAALQAHGHNIQVHAFEQLGSTNAWLADSRADLAMCITDHQSSGRGRRGRQWQSLPGNITFSITRVLPVPVHTITQLPLITGIVCAETLTERVDRKVSVKWPNDLLIGGAKLGGLLHESVATPDGPRVIAGIGVNLVHDPKVVGLGMGGETLASFGVTADERDSLVIRLSTALLDGWQQWAEQAWTVFADRWRRVDALEGRRVQVFHGLPDDDADAGFSGTACGVDDVGALVVEKASGERCLVRAGEVSVRPDE